ncbi:MAG TPA: hypothetical protein VKH44_11990, partial [Pirellulaceae bacterium]|nr:hypothetical protein [Pirellulaceae bacterium]
KREMGMGGSDPIKLVCLPGLRVFAPSCFRDSFDERHPILLAAASGGFVLTRLAGAGTYR